MNSERNPATHRRAKLAAVVFASAAGYLLLTEHRAHVVQALPWILLAACPLLHLLMHRGHHSAHGAHAPRHEDDVP